MATNLVGGTVITTQDQLDPFAGAQEIDGVLQRPMFTNSFKIYLNAGQTSVNTTTLEYPTTSRLWLCFLPAFNPPTSGQYTKMATCINNHIAAGYTNLVVCYWQEVNDYPKHFISAAQGRAMYQFYYPLMKADFPTIPIAIIFSGSFASTSLGYFPGAAYYDQASLDLYGTVWHKNGGTATTGLADPIVAQANADGKPFGFSEIGASLGNQTPLTNADVKTFLKYIIYVTGTVANAPGDVMWYDNNRTNPNNNIPPGSFLIPPIQNLYDTLMTSPPGPITSSGSLAVPKPQLSSVGYPAASGVYAIGTASAGTGGTALTVPVTTSLISGDSILIGVLVTASGVIPTVGPDTAGNAYTFTGFDTTEAGAQLYLFESDGASPLTAGTDSIPVTYSATTSARAAIAVGDDGVIGPDKIITAHGIGTAVASGNTGALSQAEEHAIAFLVDTEAGGVPAWAGGFSSGVLANVDAGGVAKISAAWSVGIPAGTSASATITSAPWAIGLTTTEVAPIVITPVPSDGIVGIAYSQQTGSTGGSGAVTYSTTGTLPPGLSMSSGGLLSGTPNLPGAYTFTIIGTDGLGVSGSLTLTLTIPPAGPSGAAPLDSNSNNLLSAIDSDFEGSSGGYGSTYGAVYGLAYPGFTWVPLSNAAAPFVTQATALTGNWCLGWTALANGPTSIAVAPCNVTPNTGYSFSCMVLTEAARTCTLSVEWLDISSNIIQTDTGPATNAAALAWTPLYGAFTPPVGAVQAIPTVAVTSCNAGETQFIDTAFFMQAQAQVLVDWVNSPFAISDIFNLGAVSSAGDSFMDVSPWLRLDNNGLTYTRGRQDAINEIQPGSGSFELQNDEGQFAQDNSISLPVVLGGLMTLQRRVQINMTDETGTWWTRYDGPISEIDYTFDNTGNTSLAQIFLTDVMASSNRQNPLACWTKEQILYDSPLYHWSLDDAGQVAIRGASLALGVTADESSGNNGPPMRLVCSDPAHPTVATIGWQDTSGGVETLANAASYTGVDGSTYWFPGLNQPSSPTRGLASGNAGPFTTPIGSVLFTPVLTAQTSQNQFIGNTGYMLEATLPVPIAPTASGSDYSVECWFMPSTSIASSLSLHYGPYIVLGLGSSRTYTNLVAGLFLNSGTVNIECATYSQPPAFLGLNWPGAATPTATANCHTAFTPDVLAPRPHHMVITFQGDPSAATLVFWIDGSQVGSFTLPKGQTYDTITIGGAYGGCGAFAGNISLASVYPYTLSAQQITQHCMLGQYAMWEQTTDDAIALLGQLSGIPAFWSNLTGQGNALTMAEYLDITDSNAISSMQQFEQAEHGTLFVNSQGQLTFHTRAWRMGYGGPDLYLPPGSFDAALGYHLVDQFQCNEEGLSGPNTLGATAVTTLVNPATGQTTTQTSTSTLMQAGYVNIVSQDEYGIYATSPLSQPLALALITWSRGYAALGLPAYSYWPDPGLTDRAAWDANSRSDPWFLPTTLTIDLLTFAMPLGQGGPGQGGGGANLPVGISSFYALDIDNMLAPLAPPLSFPNAQTSLEWFIEGITETLKLGGGSAERTIEFYTSPAEPQRAWIPGDPTYGVLGFNTRLGISAADMSVPQADGKDVSHDAGPPYWPPAFSTYMNSSGGTPVPPPIGNAPGGFVGAADVRGISQSLQLALQPPMCVVAAKSQTQSVTNGALTQPTLFFDEVFVDTTAGMGAIPGWPNWYLVTVPGWYEIDACLTWSITGAGLAGYTGQSWIVVAQAAAQSLASNVATPLTVNQYICPVGEAVAFNASSVVPVDSIATRMYLGLGDMVALACEHNYTSSRGTSSASSGTMLSLRFTGLGQTDDRTLINTLISSGGTVSLVTRGVVQQATFQNTHTYSYRGASAPNKNGRRNSDLGCYQGEKTRHDAGGDQGSQTAQIVFNVANIQSTLSGHTVLSATLTGTNINTYYSSGGRLMLGTTNVTPGGNSFNAPGSWTTTDMMHQFFTQGQQGLVFSIPIAIVNNLNSGGAQALVLGDGQTTNLDYSGEWAGGPGSWTLTVNYV